MLRSLHFLFCFLLSLLPLFLLLVLRTESAALPMLGMYLFSHWAMLQAPGRLLKGPTVARSSASQSYCFGRNHHRITKSRLHRCMVLKIQFRSDFLIGWTHLRGLHSTFVTNNYILEDVEAHLKLSKTTLDLYAMWNKTLIQVITQLVPLHKSRVGYLHLCGAWDWFSLCGLLAFQAVCLG